MTPEDELPPAPAESASDPDTAQLMPANAGSSEPAETRLLKWVILGKDGVRTGWLVGLFLALSFLVIQIFGLASYFVVFRLLHRPMDKSSAGFAILNEVISLVGILGAGLLCAVIERRRLRDYYLTGPRRVRHFIAGSLSGVVALTLLIGLLYEGHWLRFNSVALSGMQVLTYGALWGIAFLLTAFFEEGSARCYMLFTLARGINFWWAMGTVTAFSLFAAINPSGNGSVGVYLMAALGLVPCLLLHLRNSPSAGFWQAAWLTSTFFGYIHTFNDGETWMGIFSAAFIGLVFCASVRLTGSVWWALGFHASWDWAQTFFYGTPDSGMVAKGHYLVTDPVGALLWSGGSDGPEGSLLVIPVVLVVLLGLALVYGRQSPKSPSLTSEIPA